MFSTSPATRNGMIELTVDQLDAVSGGTAAETATGVALVATIADATVAGLNVVGALLGATHTKG